MSEGENIAALLEEAYFGEPGRGSIAWHGESVNMIVQGIDPDLAARRFAGASHSIWEIVLHVIQWDEVCVRRLSGEGINMTTGDPGDWPDLPEKLDADGWRTTLAWLKQAQQAMIESARNMSKNDLLDKVLGTNWSAYLMLHRITNFKDPIGRLSRRRSRNDGWVGSIEGHGPRSVGTFCRTVGPSFSHPWGLQQAGETERVRRLH